MLHLYYINSDNVSQQYYLRARYYNPKIGRFTQEDTFKGDGLNLYAYCKYNPVSYYDPSGYVCEKKYNQYLELREKGFTASEAYKVLNNENINIIPNAKNSMFYGKCNIRRIEVYNGIDTKVLNGKYDILGKKGSKFNKNQVYSNMKVRLNEKLVIDMPYVGKGKNANAAGYLRDRNYYFNKLLEQHPEYFSESNKWKINNGFNPINDSTFRKYFPEYDVKNLRNNPLIHHHVGGGKQAVAIPKGLHSGSGGIHNNEKSLGIWNNGLQ